MNTEESTEARRCARVLIADEHDHVLLLHSSGFVTPESQFFVTIGGGLDKGESLADAAVRELFEETGLRAGVDELGSVVAHTEGGWYAGHQEHSFYFLRSARFEVSFDHLEPWEVGDLTGSAWLSVSQLEAVDHAVFPVPIAGLIKRLLDGEVPAEPVELDWVSWTGGDKRCPIPD